MNAFIILSLCVVAVFSQNANYEQQGLQLCMSSGASATACNQAHNCIQQLWANKPRPTPGSPPSDTDRAQMMAQVQQCATSALITPQQQQYIQTQMQAMPHPQYQGQQAQG